MPDPVDTLEKVGVYKLVAANDVLSPGDTIRRPQTEKAVVGCSKAYTTGFFAGVSKMARIVRWIYSLSLSIELRSQESLLAKHWRRWTA